MRGCRGGRCPHPLPVAEDLLVQGDRLGRAARRLVGDCEVGRVAAGCRGGRCPAPAQSRGGSARAGRSPQPCGPPPGRRWRGCSARPRRQDGRCPAPAQGRGGSARAGRSPQPCGPPPGRRWRGCSAWSGCRGGRCPAPAPDRRAVIPRFRSTALRCHLARPRAGQPATGTASARGRDPCIVPAGRGRAVQGHDLLNQVPAPRLGSPARTVATASARSSSSPAAAAQVPPTRPRAAACFPDHPHHQTVRRLPRTHRR